MVARTVNSQAADEWLGHLQLQFAPSAGRTALVQRRHFGPLMVQSPFYPEGPVCHIYLLHPPGGVAGGDRLELDVDIEPGAEVLLTTPAATKIYRAAEKSSRLAQNLHLDHNAALEWLPQETIVFPGARNTCTSRFHVSSTARLFAWENVVLGRPANDEAFSHGTYTQGIELYVDGKPRVLDRVKVDPGEAGQEAPWGLDGHRVFSTVVVYPSDEAMLEAARKATRKHHRVSAGATEVDQVLVVRILGQDLRHAKMLALDLWVATRPLLTKRNACMPRIWAT